MKLLLGIFLSLPLWLSADSLNINSLPAEDTKIEQNESGWKISFGHNLAEQSTETEKLLNISPRAWRKHAKFPHICGYNCNIDLELKAPGDIEYIDVNATIANYSDSKVRTALISYSTDGRYFKTLAKNFFGAGTLQFGGKAKLSGASNTIWLRFQRVIKRGDTTGRDGYIVFRSISFSLKGVNKVKQPVYTIVIPDDPVNIPRRWSNDYLGAQIRSDLTQKLAAERLRLLIRLATGLDSRIVKAKDAPKSGELIYVGYGKHLKGKIEPPTKPEGLKIAEKDGNIFLLGQIVPPGTNNWKVPVDLGIMHAIETFAERVMGYRFLVSTLNDNELFELGTAIPELKELKVKSGLLIEDAPVFSTRLRSSGVGKLIGERTGSSSNFSCNHSYGQAAWARVYGKKHPEMFLPRPPKKDRDAHSEAMGEQAYLDFLDYTNPLVLEKRLEHLEIFFKTGNGHGFFGGRLPTSSYIMEEPPDVIPPTVQYNKRSKELFDNNKPLWGEFSNIWFDYMNRLGKEIKSRWPQMRIATLAYYRHYALPTFELEDNIDVMLCLMCSSMQNKEPYVFKKNLAMVKAWSKKLGGKRERLYLWEYGCWPGFFVNVPIVSPFAMQKWLQTVRPYISGVFFEFYPPGGQFPDYLMGRLWTRLLWNPDLDVDADIKDFCQHFYGSAAATMYAFYMKLIKRYEMKWSNPKLIWNQFCVDPSLYYGQSYTEEQIRALHAMLNQACRQTGVEPNRLEVEVKHRSSVYLFNEQDKKTQVNLVLTAEDTLLNPCFGWKGGRISWKGILQLGQKLKIRASDKAELIDIKGKSTDVSNQLEGRLPELAAKSADIIYFWHRGKGSAGAKLRLAYGSGIDAEPDAKTTLAQRLNWQRIPYFYTTVGQARPNNGFFVYAHLFHTNNGRVPEYKVVKRDSLDDDIWKDAVKTELVLGRKSSGNSWDIMGYAPWLRTWISFIAVKNGLAIHFNAEGKAVKNEKVCLELNKKKFQIMLNDKIGEANLLHQYNSDNNGWQATVFINWSELGLQEVPQSIDCQIIRERGKESYIWSPPLNMWVNPEWRTKAQGPGKLNF